jgi:hypothetical protein
MRRVGLEYDYSVFTLELWRQTLPLRTEPRSIGWHFYNPKGQCTESLLRISQIKGVDTGAELWQEYCNQSGPPKGMRWIGIVPDNETFQVPLDS